MKGLNYSVARVSILEQLLASWRRSWLDTAPVEFRSSDGQLHRD